MPSPTVTSPQVAVNDIGSAEDFLAAIDKTIKYFNDGDIVEGTIVRSIVTKSCSTSVTRPRVSSPPANFPSSTTSTPMRLCPSAMRWKPSSSPKRTKKAA